jgi:hypothetical protein
MSSSLVAGGKESISCSSGILICIDDEQSLPACYLECREISGNNVKIEIDISIMRSDYFLHSHGITNKRVN